jgi:hypothetical protein
MWGLRNASKVALKTFKKPYKPENTGNPALNITFLITLIRYSIFQFDGSFLENSTKHKTWFMLFTIR